MREKNISFNQVEIFTKENKKIASKIIDIKNINKLPDNIKKNIKRLKKNYSKKIFFVKEESYYHGSFEYDAR